MTELLANVVFPLIIVSWCLWAIYQSHIIRRVRWELQERLDDTEEVRLEAERYREQCRQATVEVAMWMYHHAKERS